MSEGSKSAPVKASDAELEAMLDNISPMMGGKAKERRSHKRFSIERDATAKLFKAPGQPQLPIRLCDISVTGAGLLCRRVFANGEPFIVVLSLEGKGNKLVLCETRSCKYEKHGLYRVAVQFVASHADPEARCDTPGLWQTRYAKPVAGA